MNSCNPVFIGLGQQIGVEKYYDYLEKFGLLQKTGIDLPGEANSIFLKEEKVAVIPGSAFGPGGEGFVRACYAASMKDIAEAIRRLDHFLKKLREEQGNEQ